MMKPLLAARRALPCLLLVACAGRTGRPASLPDISPSQSAEDQAEYRQVREATMARGRAVEELVRQNRAGELHRLFNGAMAAAVSLAQITQVVSSVQPITGRGPEGAPINTTRAPSFQTFWNEGGVLASLEVVFDAEGKIAGLLIHAVSPEAPGDPADGRPPVHVRMPLRGAWLVLWGGDNLAENYHRIVATQRFAYDLAVWHQGAVFTGDGARNEQYWAWGREVLAPVDGEVVEVETNIPDNTPGDMGLASGSREHPAGNHVVIRVASGAFVLLAHFQRGSVAVRAGDRVRAGQRLGLCGNSGHTSEPHLHMHAESHHRDPARSSGLRLIFDGVEVDGSAPTSAEPRQGNFVRAAEGSPRS